MEKRELIYEGKAKRIYTTDQDGQFIQEFTDDATAGDGPQKGAIPSKGVCNNKISSVCFEMLEKEGVATHFVKQLNDRDMLIRRLRILPLEVVCSNVAAGGMSKRLGLPEGEVLPLSVVEFHLKNDALNDPLINHDHIKVCTNVTEGQVKILQIRTLEINVLLKRFFDARDIVLVDFKLEFGLDGSDKILLGNEISPDTCRLWDKATHEKLDKDRFRRDLGGVESAYKEVLRRVTDQKSL